MYEPIVIDGIGEGRLRGYSDALGLYVCWEDGRLRFFDPRMESYLRSCHDEDATRAIEEERVSRLAAQTRAGTAEARAEEERAGRVAAESRQCGD